MGTNYYAETVGENPCPHCKRGDNSEELHIGKSSAGWCFSLHVIPEKGLNSLEAWKAFLVSPEVRIIRDEYRRQVTLNELLLVITEREWKRADGEIPYGYISMAHFHRDNHSTEGPNGLMRHAIGRHCVGHGDGTWDLIPGEFS